MAGIEIKKNIFWVGAVDWNVRTFHGHTYSTKRGTTYNSYLILDEKVALVDTVFGPFSAELIENIKRIIPLEKIDYIIANHVETDHSGALPEIMKLIPRAKLFGTAKCQEGLYKHYHQNWDFNVVHTQDTLKLGKRTLSFLEAPMIHWPDSMFTYCPEEELLLPNDAFGQHYASSERFDDEVDNAVLMDEAEKYYANILWPLGPVILKKLEEVNSLRIPINMIAPSHGIIWRKNPSQIINAYLSWTKNITKPQVVIVYETMWGSTEKMARALAEGIIEEGVTVKLMDITQCDRTELIKEMFEAKGYLIGSSTHDNDMLTNIAGFLEFLKGLRPQGRVAAVFGSYGWAGGAIKSIEKVLKEAKIQVLETSVGIQYVPDAVGLKSCVDFGKEFAQKIK